MLRTVLQGWRLLARDWLVLARIAWLPLGVVVALDFYLADIWERQLEGSPYTNLEYAAGGMNVLMNLDLALALVLGGVIVALWHRVQLTGPRVLSILGLLSAWRNIVALTAHWCGLILVTIGLTWVFGSQLDLPVTDFLNRILIEKFGLADNPALYRILKDLALHGGPLFAGLYISGRLGLMLWARPAGDEVASGKAWAAGRGNGWRIAAALFLALVPVLIFVSVLQPIAEAAGGILQFYIWSDLANLLQLIVAVAVISAAHRALLGDDNAADATASTDANAG